MHHMTRRGVLKGALAAAAVVSYAGAADFLSTYGPAPLDRPRPYDDELPPASPPPGMAAFRIPTGFNHRTAAFAYRGGAFSDQRDSVSTVVLVTHPRGDVLIDTGLGRQIDSQFLLLPASLRVLTQYRKIGAAADQLDVAGYDRSALRGMLLTHAHWDHTSGVADFPGVPVLLPQSERDFIAAGGAFTQFISNTANVNYQVYDFEGGPYLGFPSSHDLYGDGSLVVVPAPGHTPGSVITFMTLPDSRRFALVGDLAWQREGITELEERPWLARVQDDIDPGQVRDNLLRMSGVAQRFPEMILAPAHDARGLDQLPLLS
jgi:glyoxylase-like metal-dependent hydrolase (beta-lactamase superfamily II)